MKPIIQEETTGCGIAAVANILGKSYQEVKGIANNMGIYATDTSLWSDTQYVRRILTAFGVNTSNNEQPFTTWDDLPNVALLPIKHHQENGQNFWHWTVYIRKNGQTFVLDSASYLANNMRTDFDVMFPQWYIEVYSSPQICG